MLHNSTYDQIIHFNYFHQKSKQGPKIKLSNIVNQTKSWWLCLGSNGACEAPVMMQGCQYQSEHLEVSLSFSCKCKFHPPSASQLNLIYGHPQPSIHPHPPVRKKKFYNIQDIIDNQIVYTSTGGFQKYLVKWKGYPTLDSKWTIVNKLQKLNMELLER